MKIRDNRKIIYQAIFINSEDAKKLIEMQGEKLPNEVRDMHCTFKFHPSESEIQKFSKLLGKEVALKVVGYYSDGKNSGYEIELTEEQEVAYNNVHTVENENGLPTSKRTTPHATVSMADGAKAVDTGMLPFSRDGFEPFYIHGKAGFFTSRFIGKERRSEIVFEPVLINSVDREEDKENHIK